MHKEDGITKLIDGEVYYKFDYANFLYKKLQEKDDEIDKYKNVIDKIKELIKSSGGYKGICTQPQTDTFSYILELLEEVE